MKTLKTTVLFIVLLVGFSAFAKEYHVSKTGNDENPGTKEQPFLTISAAAKVAQPGDVVTVHEGTYRERVNPPRGGFSNENRIVYRAAEGETVIIKGSEIITGWKKEKSGLWMVKIPKDFFGDYNPYIDIILGDWFSPMGRYHHTGEVYVNGKALYEEVSLDHTKKKANSWFCTHDTQQTFIWGNFGDKDPNKELIEINVREACFYPSKPGRNYITVSGFTMKQAATQWAPPTAEQIGMIGTHWSKGWIIENNIVSDSKCSGISLGKDRSSGHNEGIMGAPGQLKVIEKAWELGGWTKEKIGHHIVRNNVIYDCGQAGVVGHMGGAFSEVTNNHIYNICVKKPYKGWEQAGIKLHGPVDGLIKGNLIHDVGAKGIWMDWMTQGTRVTQNVIFRTQLDMLFEVNHGPFVADNNIFLSKTSVRSASSGGLYAHNLIGGRIYHRISGRLTPYLKPHSAEKAGLSKFKDADHKLYNNLFLHENGPEKFNVKTNTIQADGNVYFQGGELIKKDNNPLEIKEALSYELIEKEDGVYLSIELPKALSKQRNKTVTTAMLGKTLTSKVPFKNYDGNDLKIDTDYFGKKRHLKNPTAGPFETYKSGKQVIKVWPIE